MGKKFLVIGSTGFIGRKLFEKSKNFGDVYGTSSKENSSSECLKLDLRHPLNFDYTQYDANSIVFFTAANSSPDQCMNQYNEVYNINVTGTSLAISAFMERKAKVIFFSSDTVFGENEQPFDESYPKNPAGKYAEMKLEIEEKFKSFPNFKAVHLSYVFSKQDKFSTYLLNCHRNNYLAEIYHPFNRSVVYLDDLCKAVINLGLNWDNFQEGSINLGGPHLISRLDFARLFNKIVFKDLKYTVTEPDAAFFENRPRAINMKSPLLKKILGRDPLNLEQSIRTEFNSEIQND